MHITCIYVVKHKVLWVYVRNVIPCSYDRNLHIDFHSGCTRFHIYQRCIRSSISFFKKIYFMYMSTLLLSSDTAEEGTRSHFRWLYGFWELNSGPMEEQSVLLTTEPFSSPQNLFVCLFVCLFILATKDIMTMSLLQILIETNHDNISVSSSMYQNYLES